VLNPNPEEVGDFKYVALDWVVEDIKNHPENYTVWFMIALKEVADYFEKK
jgi:isopentenyl-diphosphate delta-isomerase